MNETRETKCPLCGAPATVTVAHNARGEQFEVDDFCYKEPPAPPVPPVLTVHGYNVEFLKMVAALMMNHGITPDDLHDLKDNFQRAFNILREDQDRARRTIMEQMLQGFKTDTFPHIKLKD